MEIIWKRAQRTRILSPENRAVGVGRGGGLNNAALPVSEGIYCVEESDQAILPQEGRLKETVWNLREGLEVRYQEELPGFQRSETWVSSGEGAP